MNAGPERSPEWIEFPACECEMAATKYYIIATYIESEIIIYLIRKMHLPAEDNDGNKKCVMSFVCTINFIADHNNFISALCFVCGCVAVVVAMSVLTTSFVLCSQLRPTFSAILYHHRHFVFAISFSFGCCWRFCFAWYRAHARLASTSALRYCVALSKHEPWNEIKCPLSKYAGFLSLRCMCVPVFELLINEERTKGIFSACSSFASRFHPVFHDLRIISADRLHLASQLECNSGKLLAESMVARKCIEQDKSHGHYH